MKVILAVITLSAAALSHGESLHGTSSIGGLSGFIFLPASQVIEEGSLRLQGRLDYTDLKNSSNSYLVLPLSVTWGWIENLEIGGEIPFYLDDSGEDSNILGDITIGCSWLYETARGGSSLALRGQLRLPTGQEGRDRGTELVLGAATSTTFRLFRLQASASYVLGGGKNSFEESIDDYMNFSVGGASYVAENVQIVCAMDGNTLGDLGLSGTGILYMFDSVSLFGSLRAGLNGGEALGISAGVAWTGSGF
jgi:hypothetical protein